jgi:phage tail-like protein
MSGSPPQPSRLLQYLPAIYAEPAINTETPFLGLFLLAFEKLLFGRDDGGKSPAAFDRIVAGMPAYWIPRAVENDPFLPAGDDIPRQAPEEFLAWLGSWTAFSLSFDLDKDQQREFIARVIPLYRRRGTKASLEELLKIFTLGVPTIIEANDAPHFFKVTAVWLKWQEPEVQLRQIAIAKAIIELGKPAHTKFTLDPRFPSMQIGVHSTIGKNTLLGTVPTEAAT